MAEVVLAHTTRSELEESRARRRRVGDDRRDVHRLARRREGTQTLDPFLEQDRCAVEVAAPPVMETDADLQDPVIEATDRRWRSAPEQLERLVLLEELDGVELVEASEPFGARRVVAAAAKWLVWRGLRPLRR